MPERDTASSPIPEVRDALAYDRTHLANERTFAAWLRTGLSMAAGGIAIAHLVPEPARDSWVALLLGMAFVLLGIGVIAYSARQFAHMAANLARESGRPSPAPTRAVFVLTALVAVLLLAVLLFLWSHRGAVRNNATAIVTGEEEGLLTGRVSLRTPFAFLAARCDISDSMPEGDLTRGANRARAETQSRRGTTASSSDRPRGRRKREFGGRLRRAARDRPF